MGMTSVTGKNATGETKNMMAAENVSGHLAAATVMVDENGNRVGVKDSPLDVSAKFGPTITDSFGRVRMSGPHSLFASKQISDNGPLFWDEALISGAGITGTWSKDEAGTTFSSTLNTAGRYMRRTFESFNYQSGKSQMLMMSGNLGTSGGGTGVQRRLGLYNEDNGLFFEDNEGTMNVVIRSKVTGSVVNTKVAQASWNLDVMDGSGDSGVTIDWTKSQIFIIDFQWLGVGKVRFGVINNGIILYVHAFTNENVSDGVYMSTPNLPLTYEMVTTASSPASSMLTLCTSVMTEGEDVQYGHNAYVSTSGVALDANDVGTLYALIGVRLKTSHIGTVMIPRSMSILAETNDNFEWLFILNPTIAGTFTYTDLTDESIQFALGQTANTVTNGNVLAGGFGTRNAAASNIFDTVKNMGVAIDGTRDQLVLCVRPLGASADIQASMTFKEIA